MFPSIAISIVIFLLAKGTYSFVYKKYSNSYKTDFKMRSHVVQNQQNFKTIRIQSSYERAIFNFSHNVFVKSPNVRTKAFFKGG